MKELTTKLTAVQLFNLGRAAEAAGFQSLEEFAASILIKKGNEFAALTAA